MLCSSCGFGSFKKVLEGRITSRSTSPRYSAISRREKKEKVRCRHREGDIAFGIPPHRGRLLTFKDRIDDHGSSVRTVQKSWEDLSSLSNSLLFPSFLAIPSHHPEQTLVKALCPLLEVLLLVILWLRRLKEKCSPSSPEASREKNPSVGAFTTEILVSHDKLKFNSMVGKLIFSFDKDLSYKQIDLGSNILFGLDFHTLKLSMNGEKLVNLNAAELDSPILELILGLGPEPLNLSKEERKSKSTVKTIEVKSIFEKGSSSKVPFISKNQKKNYLRRVRRKIAKSRKVVEVKTLSQVEPEAIEDILIHASSPLLRGSRFHPLAAAEGEARVARIASSLHARWIIQLKNS
ncbi:hypothetical protein IEQ34_016873 [Dendrobium chrysotoxum]|uniref:Uncharacterized protein n=1 Tax=Dendrobium chrysotoxum TaxID=161865 RepID=A0AAV7FZD0_DENCH|nr:hypothetical protein IEQ34_016873 [Dendrobium chrysotoxum]